ncbi:serine/threonine protein kinase [Cylindrospermum sp. NIES-4074]|nr:serine/threonine protein kinase [Cylindrospermum sp. NIES-4074]
MSLCIRPNCPNPQNPDNILFCLACGSELLLEGRYRVASILGGGGFGKTFAVSDARSNTTKVLKVLINEHPKAVELFQREAEVLARLNHPGIPNVDTDGYFTFFPHSSQEPLHCLVMEKIEGLDLEKYLRQRGDRPIDQKMAVQWLTEIVTILQKVHEQNFFHRDIKPPNIMLRADGRLALIDFGTARAVTGTYVAKQAIGQVTGVISAGYTPSEQINGQAVQQSDFFALGRTFVYLLTGKDPSHFYDPINDVLSWRDHATHISPQFADLLDQMMARLVSQRPQNAEVILQSLANINQSSQLGSTPTQPTAVPRVPPTQPVTHQPPVSSQIAPNFGASPLVAQVSSSPGNKTNVALIIGLGCFLPFVGLFLLIGAIALPSFLNQANKAKQSEAKTYIGSMNRAQQAYFLENNKFSSTIAELQLGIKSETQNYSYSVNVINPKQSVRLTAKAKVSGLKSYTGAVFVQNAKEFLTIAGTCETTAPSQTPPNMPELVKGAIQCPAGSQSLAR